jgi:hypothetical protein
MEDQDQQHSPRLLFCGNGDSVKTFIMRLKMALHLKRDYDDDLKKIAFSQTFLADAALSWFEDCLNGVELHELKLTFAEFCTSLVRDFTDQHAEIAARSQLADLPYCSPVSDFVAKFTAISLKIKDQEAKDKAFQFTNKLPPAMRSYVLLQAPETLAAAATAARLYEHAYPTPISTSSGTSSSISTNVAHAELKSMMVELIAIQQKQTHPTFKPRSNKMSDSDHQRCISERRCFKCKKTGHSAKDCRGSFSSSYPSS